MLHFAPITYVDVLPIVGGLWKRRNDFTDMDIGSPVKVVWLREHLSADPTDIGNTSAMKDWVNIATCLNKIRAMLGAQPMGLAFIEELPPRSIKPWTQETGEYFELHRRFQLPLVTNPACVMYAGVEFITPQVGHLIECNPRVWHSATNMGDHPRYHFVMDIRRPVTP